MIESDLNRIVGYSVIVTDESAPGVPSVRVYSFPTLAESLAAAREARAHGCRVTTGPIRRLDLLAEEWALGNHDV